MSGIDIISDEYKELFGESDIKIVAIPASGSDRKYFRITSAKKSIIGAYNPDREENEAFVGFTNHFISKRLPVPEIYGYLPEKRVYFLQDLGDLNLYEWLHERLSGKGFDLEAEDLYKKILDKLIQFQIEGIKGLDLDLCYPHRSFDRQSMMWDVNYFKYMFLKLIAVPFNEQKLEQDYNLLIDFLLETGQDYFLYRDFQSANVMIVDGEPWFIDYQGGRLGAPQYDVASLLFDSKAHIPKIARQKLLDHYVNNFCSVSGENEEEFRAYLTGFSMIRLMQALGAFGLRGLYEKKPTFTGSIVPAVILFIELMDSELLPVSLPELFKTVRLIPDLKIFNELSHNKSVN